MQAFLNLYFFFFAFHINDFKFFLFCACGFSFFFFCQPALTLIYLDVLPCFSDFFVFA